MDNEALRRAAAHWSRPRAARRNWWQRRSRPRAPWRNWWQHDLVVRHVNRLICGEPVAGVAGGDVVRLRERGPFAHAASVGAGSGSKEMLLLRTGVVERFDLYEIADVRVEQGIARAAELGLADRITWHRRPADFDEPVMVDLVYWNNALHHMLDTDRALRWSRASLPKDGTFYMNDYVGPNRFQWPDEMLAAANTIRRELGAKPLHRPDPAWLATRDPTESADSEAILARVERHFPGADVTPTGGVVYHLALQGLLDEIEDDRLASLLDLDAEYAREGLTHYAVAVGP